MSHVQFVTDILHISAQQAIVGQYFLLKVGLWCVTNRNISINGYLTHKTGTIPFKSNAARKFHRYNSMWLPVKKTQKTDCLLFRFPHPLFVPDIRQPNLQAGQVLKLKYPKLPDIWRTLKGTEFKQDTFIDNMKVINT